jgi:hypothetical protein
MLRMIFVINLRMILKLRLNVHEQYEEYVKQAERKQSADIFEDEKNDDVISRL